MTEVVFPCTCGMILKVYGDDQVGQEIVCPSCGSTVIVPTRGIAVDSEASLGSDGSARARASSNAGNWSGIAYLVGVVVLTLGLIKFLLLPALAPPVTVAQRDPAESNEPKSSIKDPDSDEVPRRLIRRPAPRTPIEGAYAEDGRSKKRSTPRIPLASTEPPPGSAPGPRRMPKRVPRVSPGADDETEKPDEPVPPPPTAPSGPFGKSPAESLAELAKALGGMPSRPGGGVGRGFGRMPFEPRGGMEGRGIAPGKDTRSYPMKPSPPPGGASDTEDKAKVPRLPKGRAETNTTKKSVYEHIVNKEAREALEHAAINTTNFDATYVAENFLKIAEKAAGGDPKVLAEVKKLRSRIALIRNEPPPR